MKKYITIKEAVDNCEKEHTLIPSEFLSVFPNNFGINLCAVKGFEVEMTDDNQYKWIRIDFIPVNKKHYERRVTMAKYINKDTLIAEIISLKAHYECGWNSALEKILDYIDDLEVKEVNLEEEIANYINRHYHIKFDETLERGNDPLTTIDFEAIAKYFFELGMQQSKKYNNYEKNNV